MPIQESKAETLGADYAGYTEKPHPEPDLRQSRHPRHTSSARSSKWNGLDSALKARCSRVSASNGGGLQLRRRGLGFRPSTSCLGTVMTGTSPRAPALLQVSQRIARLSRSRRFHAPRPHLRSVRSFGSSPLRAYKQKSPTQRSSFSVLRRRGLEPPSRLGH